MKTSTFLLRLLFLLAAFPAFSQSMEEIKVEIVEPPKKVLEGFDIKFKGEKLVFGWRKVGDLYISTFQHNGGYKYCAIDAKGIWQEEGIQKQLEDVSDEVINAVPELDITAFLVECFEIQTRNDQSGFMFLYETEDYRYEFVIDKSGKMLRKAKYLIPENAADGEEDEGEKEEEWR